MSASSQSRKVAEQMKAKKVERRHAIEKGKQPEDSKLEHQQATVGGVSAETSDSDSSVGSGKAAKKAAPKKAAAKKKAAQKS